MANKIILKKSSVAAKVPLATDLEVGEIAVNLADKKLYSKDAGGTVIQLGGSTSGGGITYVAKTANYTAASGEGILANTSGGAFTVTLPASPSTGAQVIVADAGNTWGTNNLTIGRNGSTIEGAAENLVCDISGVSVQLIYSGTTWEIYAQVGAASGRAVTGPASATNNAIALFDGTTGALIKDSAKTLPSGAIVGTNDAQVLTQKTIAYADNTLTGVQPTLVSGTNIKTINGTPILGSGDISTDSAADVLFLNANCGGF